MRDYSPSEAGMQNRKSRLNMILSSERFVLWENAKNVRRYRDTCLRRLSHILSLFTTYRLTKRSIKSTYELRGSLGGHLSPVSVVSSN